MHPDSHAQGARASHPHHRMQPRVLPAGVRDASTQLAQVPVHPPTPHHMLVKEVQ